MQLNKNYKPHRNKVFSIIIIVVSLLCCLIIGKVLFEFSYSKYPKYESDTNYTIDDLVWNIENKAMTSRTSYITPPTANCKAKFISKNNLNSIFQISNYKHFLSKNSKHQAIFDGDRLHTIISSWQLENSRITMKIDPNNYPVFLFSGKTQMVNGYNIAAYKSNFNAKQYEIDIGFEKDGIGIWIIGDNKCEKQIDKLFNLILNQEISLKF